MVHIRYPAISVLLLMAYIMPQMDEVSRYYRSLFIHLYDPRTNLSTVSPFYTDDKTEYNSTEEEEPKPNQHFINYQPTLNLEDSDKILQNKKLVCNPKVMGYNKKSGEDVFPNYTYPPCQSHLKGPSPDLHFDLTQNTFSMSCRSGSPSYILEHSKNKKRLFLYGEYSSVLRINEYSSPVKLKDQEFAFGSCDGKTFNNAAYVFRKNQTVFESVKKKMSSLGLADKPMIVMILTVDSFSRRHFYRKLPKTLKFLNSLNTSHSVFDYYLHNTVGQSSVDNMVPILSEKPFEEKTVPREYDVHKEASMWNFFKSKGFATLIGFEDCDYNFPNTLGRFVEVDHLIRSFYCTARRYGNLNYEIDTNLIQRCIGPKMSHWYTLNYTFAFTEGYQGLNQWIYIHLNTAHEGSGQHAGTLDDDLYEFLSKYFQKFGSEHEIALFLQADHGMRYGKWYQDIEAYQENKLPALFVIVSKSLLLKIPGSYDNLLTNTERFTVKTDLRPTIKLLADLPYGILNNETSPPFYNLFTQKSPLSRTCETAEVSPFDCSCFVVQELKNYKENPDFYQLIMKVIEVSLFKINSEVATPVVGMMKLCQKLSFRKILNVYGLKLNNKVEELQIKFGVNENFDAVFEVFAFVGSHPRSTVLIASSYRSSISTYVYRGIKTRIKIFGIKRKDKYAGKCENTARDWGIRAEFCICDEEVQNTIILNPNN